MPRPVRPIRPLAVLALAAGLLLLGPMPALAQTRTPVVFVPGLLGSTLVNKEDPYDLAWGTVHAAIDKFAELELDVDPEQDHLRVGEVILEIGSRPQYRLLVEPLQALGYEVGEDLFLFPYDWRVSNFKTVHKLRAFIEENGLADRDIHLIGHSMGGLVSLLYIHLYPAGAARVKTFISMGTPYLGSVDSLQSLAEGFTVMDVGNAAVVPAGNTSIVYRVFSSFQSLYELLPTYNGCCYWRIPELEGLQPFNLFDLDPWYNLGLFLEDASKRPGHELRLRVGFLNLAQLSELVQRPMPAHIRRIAVFSRAGEETPYRVGIAAGGPGEHVWERRPTVGDGTVLAISAIGGVRDDDLKIESSQMHGVIFDDPAIWQVIGPELAR